MKKVKGILLTMLSVIVILVIFAGCTKQTADKNTESPVASTTTSSPSDTSNGNTDYTKSVLELSFGNLNEPTINVIQNDVVGPELTKRTGVKWGKTYGLVAASRQEQINLWAQSNSLPDVTFSSGLELSQNDLTWRLALDDIKKYAPEIYKRLNPGALVNLDQGDGTIVGVPAFMSMSDYDKELNPNFPAAVGDWMDWKQDYYLAWVRDDILKQVFPDAKTWTEMVDLYAQTKKLDFNNFKIAGLETGDDFINLLRSIKKLNLTEKGKKIEPSAITISDLDQWSFISNVYGTWDTGGLPYKYNPNIGKMVATITTPEFKAYAKKMNDAVREGLFDVNAIVMKDDQRLEKIKRGEYAVINYSDVSALSNGKDLNEAMDTYKKPYHFRPVYIKFQISPAFPGFITIREGADAYYYLNKKTVKKEDIPKILNFFNYQLTKEGSDLTSYGPESAGLYTVDSNGNKKYKDPVLEDSMINFTQNKGEKNASYYGLVAGNGSTSQNCRYYCFYNQAGGPYIPRVLAWPLPVKGTVDEMYVWGTLLHLGSTTFQYQPDPTAGALEGHDDWKKQSAILNAVSADLDFTVLPRVFFAKSDGEFEDNFKKAIDKLTTDGQMQKTMDLGTSIYNDYLKKHPDLTPIPWPVK